MNKIGKSVLMVFLAAILMLMFDLVWGQNVVEVTRIREGIKVSTITFPSVQVVSGTVNVSGSSVAITNFPAIQTIAGNVVVDNFPSTQTVSVSNFPSSYDVSQSTIFVRQVSGDVFITSGVVRIDSGATSRVTIAQPSPARDLAINTYNGLDVRLIGNTGTLVSDTAPIPVNYSVMLSSYVEANITGTVKATSTYLKGILVGTAGEGSSLVISNGSATIATIDTTVSRYYDFGVICGSGLSITTTGTTPAKITIIYR